MFFSKRSRGWACRRRAALDERVDGDHRRADRRGRRCPARSWSGPGGCRSRAPRAPRAELHCLVMQQAGLVAGQPPGDLSAFAQARSKAGPAAGLGGRGDRVGKRGTYRDRAGLHSRGTLLGTWGVSSSRRWVERSPRGPAGLAALRSPALSLQRPGETTFDTKLDLTATPRASSAGACTCGTRGDLRRAAEPGLRLPLPAGPVLRCSATRRLPDWVAQRLWSALLLVVAYEGAAAGARALGLGARRPVVAGLAYAFSPRLLGARRGALRRDARHGVAAVGGAAAGARAQRPAEPRQGCRLLSGVAVLFMGGVNAVENLAALLLAAVLVLEQVRRPPAAGCWPGGCVARGDRLRCGGWSRCSCSAATARRSSTTSRPRRPRRRDRLEQLRPRCRALAGQLRVGARPCGPAAHQISTSRGWCWSTAVVAAIGLVGLVHPAMPLRGPLGRRR